MGRLPTLLVPAPDLGQDLAEETVVEVLRHMRCLQHAENGLPVSRIGIFQAQGMPGKARGPQEFAQPLTVP